MIYPNLKATTDPIFNITREGTFSEYKVGGPGSGGPYVPQAVFSLQEKTPLFCELYSKLGVHNEKTQETGLELEILIRDCPFFIPLKKLELASRLHELLES